MRPRARIALRALFALVVLSLPLMIVVRENVGEPYPGLYQPAFDSSRMAGQTFVRQEAVVIIRDGAGEKHRVEVADLVHAPRVEGGLVRAVTRTALRNRNRMRGDDAVQHIRRRAVELGIDDPRQMRVTWYLTRRSPRDADHARREARVQSYAVRLDR